MNAELKRRDFILAMIYAYLLVFAIVIPLAAGWSDQSGLFAGLLFGEFSLIFGLPVMFVTAILGYPLFKLIIGKLSFAYLANVLISCAGVSLIIALVSAFCFSVVFGERYQEFGAALMLMGIPTIVVGFVSGFIFWLRTK